MTYKPSADAYKDASIVLADLAASLIDPAAGTAGVRTLGTGAAQALPGNTAVELTSNKNAASGYAGLDGSTLLATAQHGTGTANSTTFLRGDRTWAAPTATLAVAYSNKTGAYTIVAATDDYISADAAGGAFSVTLPTAVGVTKPLTIKRMNSGANNVTVATTSSQTIDGATTYVLDQQYQSITVVSTNANWIIV
jgi:hypothetical protein